MKSSIQIKVGLLIIASFFVFVFLLFQSANWPWISSGDEIPIHFSTISDLRVGAMVQISGVQVGKITDIRLLDNKVEVMTRIDDAFETLRKGCKINIEMVGLVGETYINITNAVASNPPLTPDDLPLTGSGLTGIMGIMQRADKALEKTTEAVSILENVDKEDIETIISSLKKLIDQTDELSGQMLSNLNGVVGEIDGAVKGYQKELNQTISDVNDIVAQTQTSISKISESLDRFSQGLNRLLDDNSGKVEETVANFGQLSENLNSDTEKLFKELSDLKSELSRLVNSTQGVIDKDAGKIDQLIDNLNRSAQNINELSDKLDKVLTKIDEGDGTVAKLLNEPESIEKLNSTLTSADAAIKEFISLSDKISRKTDTVKMPSFRWDYELRYSSLSETLRNELAFSMQRSKNQRYLIGLSSIGKELDYDFQYERSFGALSARVGFIRSKPGLGFDYWLLSKRLGFSLEGIGITEKEPAIDLETKLRFLPNWFIILGVHDLIGEVGYSGGIKVRY